MPVRAPRLPQTKGERIIYEACRAARITKDEFMGYGRHVEWVDARMEAVVRLRKEMRLSTTTIGRMIRRDHATVINLIRRFEGVQGAYRSGIWKRRKTRSEVDMDSMTRAQRQQAMRATR